PAALHQGDGQRCSYSDLQLQQYAVARAGLWRSNSRLIIFDDSTLNVDFAIKRFPVGHWIPLTWKRAFLQAVLAWSPRPWRRKSVQFCACSPVDIGGVLLSN